MLLAFALGCGDRSALDVLGTPPASSRVSASSGGVISGGGAGFCGSPSCQPGGPGMTNCGASSESCCTSLEVTGGTFYRTYCERLASGPTGEADPATVSGFRLDKYLVTVGRFRQFVNAVLPPDGGTGWLPPAGSGKHTHLNGGQGLATVGASPDAGVVYEPGWATSDNSNIAPTNANLTTLQRQRRRYLDEHGWQPGEPADQLRELVRGVRLLHLGRRVSAERGGVGVRGGWGEPAAGVPVGDGSAWNRMPRDGQPVRDLQLRLPERYGELHGRGEHRARGDRDGGSRVCGASSIWRARCGSGPWTGTPSTTSIHATDCANLAGSFLPGGPEVAPSTSPRRDLLPPSRAPTPRRPASAASGCGAPGPP